MTAEPVSERFTCLAIALAYATIGGVWIYLSDDLFAILLNTPLPEHNPTDFSHGLLIAFSAIMLYWLLRVWQLAISSSQKSLKKANRALKGVSECTKAITRITDETELMQEVCKIFVEVGGYRFAWVGFKMDNVEKTLVPVANWGYEDHFIETINATWEDCERGRGPAGTTIRSGETTVFQDFRTEPNYRPWRTQAMRCGYCSGISLPLKDAEQVFGALVIFSGQPNAFDREEILRMEELAEDLSYGIKTLRMKAERKRALEEQMQLVTVIDQASEGVLTIDGDGLVQYCNPAFGTICAIDSEDAIGRCIYDLEFCKLNELFCFEIQKVIFSGLSLNGDFVNRREDGSRYEIVANISPVYSDAGISRYVVIVRDVSTQQQLERQLRQAQKLEAVATLSGGIAHDFNNILAVIISNAEMCQEDLGGSCPQQEYLDIILKAGVRGKNLVKQILSLSRPKDQKRQKIRVGPIITECFKLLRASLPTTLELQQKISEEAGVISADPTQIHQVIMNLCTNAADAMHHQLEGVLTISLETRQIAASSIDHPDLPQGTYLEIGVADTGHGMPPEVLERIFDPFYTCRKSGKGTGLGLSVARGIVRSHGGAISVKSAPGRGTCFRVLFPLLYVDQEKLPCSGRLQRARRGERILFVDDEEDYVRGQKRMLERLGYQVIAGTDSLKAFSQFSAQPDQFDLLITDQTMPHMTGDVLASKVLAVRADIPVILCSGSAEETIDWGQIDFAGNNKVRFLQKPVDRWEFCQAMYELLTEHTTEQADGEYSYC